MNKEAQRIAIAEACGWKMMPIGLMKRGDEWAQPHTRHGHMCIPEYLTDLNAMHEAEKVLTAPDWIRYHGRLRGLVINSGASQAQEICATSAQRAEAFLRTLNLWTPSP